ncbi:MAG: hypothetical protein J0L88_11055 [Xanthomonadales bacterium]|nr:hypothetical protein [Xanthomonadales bacterium]
MRACRARALGVVLALAALPALADWKDDYARGLEAVRDGRWGEAARLMDSAIAGNAQPAPRLRLYGQRYEVYAPQHYAGLAALRQGDCAAALRFWNESANKGFVAANAALGEVEQRGRADCGSAVASDAKPSTPTVPVETRGPVVESKPPAQAPPTRPAEAPPSRPVVQSPPPVSTPAKPATPIATSPTPTDARPVSSAAAEALRPVLEAYLAGRYTEVLRLSARPAADPRVGWHLQTLRAAAAWQLAQIGSDSTDAAANARQAIVEARRLDATRQPDATFYSPRFIAFYNAPL